VPDRADGVHDEPGREGEPRRDDGVAGGALANGGAGGIELGAGGGEDGAAHPAAPGEPLVRGVDDRVDRERGDVGPDRFEPHQGACLKVLDCFYLLPDPRIFGKNERRPLAPARPGAP
jgi:hypothetical protein